MKTIFYIILPVIAFLLILTNALYGHLLFVSTTEYVTTKYSVYIHLQPEWHSGSKNIIFDVTNLWYKSENNKVDSVVNSDSKEYNSNQLQSFNGKSYVELKHSFSNCQKEWQPITYGKAVDTVRHEIEYVQGNQLSTNPDISVYPDIENINYDKSQQQIKIKNGYVQFIPICTSKNTTYDYSIKTDNNDVGFDVYFVSSSVERDDFSSHDFDYYEKPGCFAQNKQSYSGTCNDVEKNGGLIIVFPDELNPWVTKVTVNLYEKK